MRVISGVYRGRKLNTPQGLATRPTLDRTKETIFNMIQHDIADAVCLDLFAGSGQIAIELISRGCRHCTIVDSGKDSISCIKGNIDTLGIEGSKYTIDYKQYTDALLSLAGKVFDLVYLDPPYHADYYNKALTMLTDNNMLSSNCLVVCESSADIVLPETVGNIYISKSRKVGSVVFTLYRGGADE